MAELLESIGHNIRRLREGKGWNQTELGFHADMSPSVVSLIENGKRNPSTATLAKIASALGVEVVDLFPKASAPLEPSLLNGLEEERRYSESGLGTESWPYRAMDSWVITIRDLIKEYEPIVRDLPEKPSAEEYAVLKARLEAFLKQTASINKAVWESGIFAAYNELWAAVRAGEPVPRDVEHKVREFGGVVEELNSKLPLPAREWLLRPPETAELERAEQWVQKFMETGRQAERDRKNETT